MFNLNALYAVLKGPAWGQVQAIFKGIAYIFLSLIIVVSSSDVELIETVA